MILVFILKLTILHWQTPMRTVPDHIGRPDYAEHPDGFPASERAVRGSTNIIQLNDEEQEGLRVAGRVSY